MKSFWRRKIQLREFLQSCRVGAFGSFSRTLTQKQRSLCLLAFFLFEFYLKRGTFSKQLRLSFLVVAEREIKPLLPSASLPPFLFVATWISEHGHTRKILVSSLLSSLSLGLLYFAAPEQIRYYRSDFNTFGCLKKIKIKKGNWWWPMSAQFGGRKRLGRVDIEMR